MEEQFHMMQQQIVALQEQLNGASTPMQSADDTATLPLHSMGVRPHYMTGLLPRLLLYPVLKTKDII
jgi:hypothetical protein